MYEKDPTPTCNSSSASLSSGDDVETMRYIYEYGSTGCTTESPSLQQEANKEMTTIQSSEPQPAQHDEECTQLSADVHKLSSDGSDNELLDLSMSAKDVTSDVEARDQSPEPTNLLCTELPSCCWMGNKGTDTENTLVFKCDLCKKVLHSFAGFKRHMRSHGSHNSLDLQGSHNKTVLSNDSNDNTGNEAYTSLTNGFKTFSYRSNLERETVNIQVLNFKLPGLICPICKSHFQHSSSLTRHLKAHQGVYPYICQSCARKFTRKDHYMQHKCCNKQRIALYSH